MTLINCNWEQMANGAGNCCLMLTNHKQTLTHEPHCLPWKIITSSRLQVNYLSWFHTLSADSSPKFVFVSLQETHRPPWSEEPLALQCTKKTPCRIGCVQFEHLVTILSYMLNPLRRILWNMENIFNWTRNFQRLWFPEFIIEYTEVRSHTTLWIM
jgi:hypothetical protein